MERQIEELAVLAKELRRETTEVTTAPPAGGAKERRSARLAQKQRHKRDRRGAADAS
ncbi:hypothetical protein RM780_22315 [Streptomyces sp. DSM 44917]|uniref:Transposase n=1 Tax=Streptomyces boetiae TaxID=3075541 RepID=A0ABU2LDM1_9ACTN|nr:hypothetical protein [Streptomyces sp. DSM 44917]MDT0309670.1 hypothetical protein [Streptomyces sp. DSM 44917]